MVEGDGSIPEEANAEATGAPQPTCDRRQGPLFRWLGLLLVYMVVLGLTEARLWRPGTLFVGATNVQIAEAQAWWNGRLDLPERWHDTALHDGKVYSHFPPMFSIIAAGLVPFFQGVPHWFMVLLALLVPLLAYELFRRLVRSPWWAAVAAIGYVCGTSLWPVLDWTIRTASPYYVNIMLANIGLLMFLIELSGRKRVWLAGLGLLIATLSRQLSVAFAIPLIWLALRRDGAELRGRRLATLAVVGVIVAAVPLVANTLKFDHPLRTGYSLIYEGRDDPLAKNAQEFGIFSPAFVVDNLYHTNLGLPNRYVITMAGQKEIHFRPNTACTGIWWTSPLLLWLFVDIRRILSLPAARWLLVAAGLVYVALLFFHATGADQRGCNRFSLDYMPALLAIIVPRCFAGRRRWISLVMIGWSVVYFRWLI